jgi:urea transporter
MIIDKTVEQFSVLIEEEKNVLLKNIFQIVFQNNKIAFLTNIVGTITYCIQFIKFC